MQTSSSEASPLDPLTSRRSRWAALAALLSVAAIETVAGWFRLFSYVLPYTALDDEGYVIVTIREWLSRGGLYDEVFWQYGPFYNTVLGGPLKLLGHDLDLTSARLLTLGLAVASTLLFGLAVLKATGSIAAALVAQVGTYTCLGMFESAVLHPVAPIAVLLGALVLIAFVRSPTSAASDAATGALTAAILFTKVNVGIFVGIAVAYVVAITWRDERQRRYVRLVPELGLVAMGPFLMLRHISRLDEMFVVGDARGATWRWLVVYEAAVVVLIAVARLLPRPSRPDDVRFSLTWLGAGFAAVAVVLIAVALATGTSAAGLVDGLVLRPADSGGALTALPALPTISWAWIAGVPLLVVGLLGTARATPTVGVRLASAALRAASAVLLLTTGLAHELGIDPPGAGFGTVLFLLPLVVLVVVPIVGEGTPARADARWLLAALCIAHSLHVFPLAGAQQGAAMALAVTAAALMLHDAGRELRAALGPDGSRSARWVTVAPALLALVGIGVALVPQARGWKERYDESVELALPGASSIRGDPSRVSQLREAVDALSQCDAFYAHPGLGTFHLFTESEPLTGFNSTGWEYMLTGEEQRAVVEEIEAAPGRVCFFKVDSVAFGGPPDAPLVAYLRDFGQQTASGPGWRLYTEEHG